MATDRPITMWPPVRPSDGVECQSPSHCCGSGAAGRAGGPAAVQVAMAASRFRRAGRAARAALPVCRAASC